MEQNQVAIQLSGVKKMYKLGQIGGGTLQHKHRLELQYQSPG